MKKPNREIEALKSEARKEARSDLAALCEIEGVYRRGEIPKITPEELMGFAVRQSQRVELFVGEDRSLLHDALFNVNELRDLIMESRARSVQ